MIDRYTTEQMKKVWSEKNTFHLWLKIEIATCVAWNKLNVISDAELAKLKKAKFDQNLYNNFFNETKHDMISFTRSVSESLGSESRWIHHGLTSNDVKDTCLSIQVTESLKIIKESLTSLENSLKNRCLEFKYTPCVGRSHGIHAEPMSFGLKLALWHQEIQRHLLRIEEVLKFASVGMISGPVGTHATVPPKIEEIVCDELGLYPAPVTNQIIQRDRHADVLQRLALIASSLEKFSTEIRSLQRTEINEIQEPFGEPGFVSTGSSSMPHKRNPELTERICGIARVIRGNSNAALENIPLWNERDISHSSAERIIIPDSFLATDYIINTFESVIKGMKVNTQNMERNLNLTGGLIFSEKIMLTLVEKGVLRIDAYEAIQSSAIESMDKNVDFKKVLKNKPLVKENLNEDEIESMFETDYFLKYIDQIFERLNFD
ncbi:MAG: adenylosuccinate lyase [Chloroflexi bacterium]|nr:adenylosuccinate lyase [Chloroflexota bacterium]|tara:strand:+ start:1711 stop:3012 length:1302 start_codon:yes stop_codon:yes gene_type:complete